MRIAVTSTGTSLESSVDARFGRAKHIIVHDIESGETESIVNETNMNAQQGAGIQTAKRISQIGAQAVLTGHVGPRAFRALTSQGISVYLAEGKTVRESIELLKQGKLELASGADVEGHW